MEPRSPLANSTKLIPHENATDDRKLIYRGVELCSPPETWTTTTVWSPAPRPRPFPNLTMQHAHTRFDDGRILVLQHHTLKSLRPTKHQRSNGGVEPCSPQANNTKLTTYVTATTNKGPKNGGAERCSPFENRPPTTVWSPAPRPWQHSDYTTLYTTPDPKNGSYQQPGLHPALNAKSDLSTHMEHHITVLVRHIPPPPHTHTPCAVSQVGDRDRCWTPDLPPGDQDNQGHQKCPPPPHTTPTSPTAPPTAVPPGTAPQRG